MTQKLDTTVPAPTPDFLNRGDYVVAKQPFVLVPILTVDPTDTNEYEVSITVQSGGRKVSSSRYPLKNDTVDPTKLYRTYYLASHPSEADNDTLQYKADFYQAGASTPAASQIASYTAKVADIPPTALLSDTNQVPFAQFPTGSAPFLPENCLHSRLDVTDALKSIHGEKTIGFDFRITPMGGLKVLTALGSAEADIATASAPTIASVYDDYYTVVVPTGETATADFYIAASQGYCANVTLLQNTANISAYFVGHDDDNREYPPAQPAGVNIQDVFYPPQGIDNLPVFTQSTEFAKIAPPEAIFWLCAYNGTTYSVVSLDGSSTGPLSVVAQEAPFVTKVPLSKLLTTGDLENTVQGFVFNTASGELSTTDIIAPFGVSAEWENNHPNPDVNRTLQHPHAVPVPLGSTQLITLDYVITNDGIKFILPSSVATDPKYVFPKVYLNGWNQSGFQNNNTIDNLTVSTEGNVYTFKVNKNALLGYSRSPSLQYSTLEAEYKISGDTSGQHNNETSFAVNYEIDTSTF